MKRMAKSKCLTREEVIEISKKGEWINFLAVGGMPHRGKIVTFSTPFAVESYSVIYHVRRGVGIIELKSPKFIRNDDGVLEVQVAREGRGILSHFPDGTSGDGENGGIYRRFGDILQEADDDGTGLAAYDDMQLLYQAQKKAEEREAIANFDSTSYSGRFY